MHCKKIIYLFLSLPSSFLLLKIFLTYNLISTFSLHNFTLMMAKRANIGIYFSFVGFRITDALISDPLRIRHTLENRCLQTTWRILRGFGWDADNSAGCWGREKCFVWENDEEDWRVEIEVLSLCFNGDFEKKLEEM